MSSIVIEMINSYYGGFGMLGSYDSGKSSNYFTESDLVYERKRADTALHGVKFSCNDVGKFTWERVRITDEAGAKSIGRPIGNYNTLNLHDTDTLDEEDVEDAANEVAKELCIMVDNLGIKPDKLLVVGLGNRNLTPDSVGPKAAEKINATMHLSEIGKLGLWDIGCSGIAVCSPGVTSKTGMEASEIITAICERIEPDAVLVIDSLASKSHERLGKTIQISDTGIFPGAGIGNRRKPLNIRTLGSHVIAIGVPTVINTRMLFADEWELPAHCLPKEEMFVTPRDIDSIVEITSKIIAGAINQAFGIF